MKTMTRGWLQRLVRECAAMLCALAALHVVPAAAADKGGREQAQVRRLQQQMRSLEQEKAQLTQQKSDAEGQLKAAQDKAAEAQQRAAALGGRSTALSGELDALKARYQEAEAARAAQEQQLTAGHAQAAELSARLADTEHRLADALAAQAAARKQWEAETARNSTVLTTCQQRNDRIYHVGNELLEKYQHKSCFAVLLQAEPLTGLKRAQVEKTVEQYREQLDKDQLLPAQLPTPGGRGAPAAP